MAEYEAPRIPLPIWTTILQNLSDVTHLELWNVLKVSTSRGRFEWSMAVNFSLFQLIVELNPHAGNCAGGPRAILGEPG